MRKIITSMFLFYLFLGCLGNEKSKSLSQIILKFNLEKIIVINNGENSVVYFKLKITNPYSKTIIMLDNSLVAYSREKRKSEKTGFYLRNIKNDSLITLGIDNYSFYEIGAKKSGYCFLGAVGLRNSCNEKDSLILRKALLNYALEYNGKKIDLNKIEKSKYISQNDFDNFIKRKDQFVPYKDSITIAKSIDKLNIKYLNKMPVFQEEWNKL